MRAVLFETPGGPEVLRIGDAPEPCPGVDEALVQVHAAGVNRADLLQRMGKYPPPPGASPLLGLEVAGTILVSPDPRFRPGERVMAVVTGGGYAERCAVPASLLMPIPERFSFEEAAAIPEAFLTAWLNLVQLGNLQPGETVVIHAGASGVGSAAIQLARERGARVIATASAEKLDFCREMGSFLAIDRHGEDFLEDAVAATGGRGVDLILDFVGVHYWERNLTALRRGGRLVLIGFLSGSRGDLDLGLILRKNLMVTGTTLRATRLERKAALIRDFAAFAAPRLASGALNPRLDRVFDFAQAAQAHRHMAENRNRGMIVLRVTAPA